MQGEVCVGVLYMVFGYFLLVLLVCFKCSYFQVEIDLVDMGCESIEVVVVEGWFDLGLMIIFNSFDLLCFEYYVLICLWCQFWLVSQYLLMVQILVSLEDVVRYVYILVMVDEGEVFISCYWELCELMLEVVFCMFSMEVLWGLVVYGFGVIILLDMFYCVWLLEGKKIEVCFLVDVIFFMEFGLIWYFEVDLL